MGRPNYPNSTNDPVYSHVYSLLRFLFSSVLFLHSSPPKSLPVPPSHSFSVLLSPFSSSKLLALKPNPPSHSFYPFFRNASSSCLLDLPVLLFFSTISIQSLSTSPLKHGTDILIRGKSCLLAPPVLLFLSIVSPFSPSYFSRVSIRSEERR